MERTVEKLIRSVARVPRSSTDVTDLQKELSKAIGLFMKGIKQRPSGYALNSSEIHQDPNAAKAIFKSRRNLFEPLTTNDYSRDQVLSHVIHQLMPSFCITQRILLEAKNRSYALEDMSNIDVLDVGAGAGAGVFAVKDVFGHHAKISAVEPASMMGRVGKEFTEAKFDEVSRSRVRWVESIGKLGNSFGQYDLTLSTFVIGEIPDKSRKDFVLSLWRTLKPGGMLILIDSGEISGMERILEARKTILEVFPPSLDNDESSYVVAPCPHDKPCPLLQRSELAPTFRKFNCKFPQRISRDTLPKGSVLKLLPVRDRRYQQEVVVDFTYLIMGKGPSPRLIRESQLEDGERRVMDRDSVVLGDDEEMEEEDVNIAHESYVFSRVVRPPMKKSGHVIIDVCNNCGDLERKLVTKAAVTKLTYKESRKARWGDLLAY